MGREVGRGFRMWGTHGRFMLMYGKNHHNIVIGIVIEAFVYCRIEQMRNTQMMLEICVLAEERGDVYMEWKKVKKNPVLLNLT